MILFRRARVSFVFAASLLQLTIASKLCVKPASKWREQTYGFSLKSSSIYESVASLGTARKLNEGGEISDSDSLGFAKFKGTLLELETNGKWGKLVSGRLTVAGNSSFMSDFFSLFFHIGISIAGLQLSNAVRGGWLRSPKSKREKVIRL